MNETINCFSNEIDEVSFIIKEDQLYIKNYVQMENGKVLTKLLVNYIAQ